MVAHVGLSGMVVHAADVPALRIVPRCLLGFIDCNLVGTPARSVAGHSRYVYAWLVGFGRLGSSHEKGSFLMSGIPKIERRMDAHATAHQFRFWYMDEDTGSRIPMVLEVDNMFNAVVLEVDRSREMQVSRGFVTDRGVVMDRKADGSLEVISIPPELVRANQLLIGKKILDDPEEEAIRQSYLAEYEEALSANCAGCELGSVTRKWQDALIAKWRRV